MTEKNVPWISPSIRLLQTIIKLGVSMVHSIFFSETYYRIWLVNKVLISFYLKHTKLVTVSFE